MKTLYLVRHAAAEPSTPEKGDIDRALSAVGESEANYIGKVLKTESIHLDAVISSSANRAQLTVEIIADLLEFPKENIVVDETLYQAKVEDYLTAISQIDNGASVVILCGHSPDISCLVGYLCNIPYPRLPTCGIYGMQFDCPTWRKLTTVVGEQIFHQEPNLAPPQQDH